MAAVRARVLLRLGRTDEAVAWVHERGLSVTGEFSYIHEYEHITLARLLLASGSEVQAAALLSDAELDRAAQ